MYVRVYGLQDFQNSNVVIPGLLGFLYPQVPTARRCQEMPGDGSPTQRCVMCLKDKATAGEWVVVRKSWIQGICFPLGIFPLDSPKFIHKWPSDNGYFPIFTNTSYFSPNVVTSESLFFQFSCTNRFYVIS